MPFQVNSVVIAGTESAATAFTESVGTPVGAIRGPEIGIMNIHMARVCSLDFTIREEISVACCTGCVCILG